MLKIFIDEIPSKENIVIDLEKQFDSIEIKGNELDKELIKEIDQGEYIDNTTFVDRFGNRLYMSELSTGCKAALCVANSTDEIIDLKECGLNARDTIICACTNGAVIIHNEAITIQDKFNALINVEIDGYRITSVERLNRYIQSERPFKPEKGSDITCLK